MADETTTQSVILPSRTAQKNFVIASLLFHWSLIVYLILCGDDKNSLHTSALAWAFGVSLLTFGAYVFGAAWDNKLLMSQTSK